MKTKKSKSIAIGAGLLVLVLPFLPWSGASFNTASVFPLDTEAVDSTMHSSYTEEYGFDRLEEEQEENIEWSREELIVSSAATIFDTLSFTDWLSHAQAVHLVKNPSGLWPLTTQSKVQVLLEDAADKDLFVSQLSRELQLKKQTYQDLKHKRTFFSDDQRCTDDALIYVVDDALYQTWSQEVETLTKLYELAKTRSVLLLYFGENCPEEFARWPISILQIKHSDALGQSMAAQAVLGSQDVFQNNEKIEASRLGYASAESVGINPEKLKDIDKWVNRAIRRRAIPGCQVLVAKGGKIVYDKAFGYHTYSKEQEVATDDVYDIASITKAAATTLAVMKLEEQGQLDLKDRIKDYLPDYKRSGVAYLRLRHLLSHHSGLQSNLPIARYLNQKDVFTTSEQTDYSLALDKDFYLKSGVRESLLASLKKVRSPRRGFYRYSDVNFILLQQLIEQQAAMPLDDYLYQNFYHNLGLQNLQFRPGLAINENRIVPTEKDKRWRKKLVQGEVHDESAALLGGVAGHAGLFSNAKDLAVLFQMLLNEGRYADKQYLAPNTIEKFIERNGYNYRAMGFDRLAGHSKNLRYYGASLKTFGHTGFTGTCVWADPDNDLIFIFLSNRVHPYKHNDKLQKMGLRERLHKIVYKSLVKGSEEAAP